MTGEDGTAWVAVCISDEDYRRAEILAPPHQISLYGPSAETLARNRARDRIPALARKMRLAVRTLHDTGLDGEGWLVTSGSEFAAVSRPCPRAPERDMMYARDKFRRHFQGQVPSDLALLWQDPEDGRYVWIYAAEDPVVYVAPYKRVI
jgi:hypothetical protein